MGLRLPYLVFFIFLNALPGIAQTYTLESVLKHASESNPALKSASYDVLLSETDIITSKLRPNPVLNNQTLFLVDQPYFHPGVPWGSNFNRQDWWQLTKDIQWPGVRKWKIRSTLKQHQSEVYNFSETQRNVLLSVATRYLNIWGNTKQLLLLQEAQVNLDSLLSANYQKLQSSKISQTDYLRTEILSEECAIQISETRLDISKDMRTLQLLTGITDSIIIDTSFNLAAIEMHVDTLVRETERSRPDILSDQSQIDFALANIKLQRHLAFPALNFGVIWNPQNTVQYVGFMATMSIPVFDANQDGLKKAFILKDQFEQNLVNTKAEAKTGITNAYDDLTTRRRNVLTYQIIYDKTEVILDEIRKSYTNGETDIIDFLEAQRSWIEGKNYFIDLQQKYYQSYINLLFETGKINQMVVR